MDPAARGGAGENLSEQILRILSDAASERTREEPDSSGFRRDQCFGCFVTSWFVFLIFTRRVPFR